METKEKAPKKLQQVKEDLNSFVEGLKSLSNEMSETEFDNFLEEIIPPILEDKTVFSTSVWNKMEVVKIVVFDSILDERGLNIEDCIRSMSAGAICYVHNLLYTMGESIDLMKTYTPMEPDHKRTIESLEAKKEELMEFLHNDSFERIQDYTFEIKKLRKLEA
ncbi:MAG: hypothetical protein CL670_14845 [Balneola sp.]|jgi:hypothetical protein|nr:hypothetical protein [Balneola sp.]MBE80434.1 hypothetical protein [Balneola sp.]HAD51276.1 hypothetical protein [Algoriphagus sp.]|tara:strand:- start:72 stop:560 length:489 start_codon:yes stop_codon:yes gene_type:complete